MNAVLLSLHVVAAIVAIGPVCVAASMFPTEARRASDDADGGAGGGARLRVLARICRVYAMVGLAVPVLGLMTASSMGVLGDVWVLVSIALTTLAFVVLAVVVLPGQRAVVDDIGGGGVVARPELGRLAASTGIFNLLWVVVTILMIVRPGSTTGV